MKRIQYAFLLSFSLLIIPRWAAAGTTVAVVMAGANDLERFTTANLNEIKALPPSSDIAIFVQLENRKGTFRYKYENNNLTLINSLDQHLKPMNNTGDPQTVIDFLLSCIRAYPENRLIVVFWDHGTGPLAPYPSRAVEFDDLCTIVAARAYNTLQKVSNPFFLDIPEQAWKGICFDDRFRSFLTEEKLDRCFSVVSQYHPIDMVIYDTCLEANICTAHVTSKYVRYMCASEEVVLARGIHYTETFTPLCINPSLSLLDFAHHVVGAYEKTYKNNFGSYTFSALDLSYERALEANVDTLAQLLIQAIKDQQKNSVIEALRTARSPRVCTSFDQTDYVDLGHLYNNILTHLKDFQLKKKNKTLINNIAATLKNGLAILNQLVIVSSVGPKKSHARGISIYFPVHKVHPSYKQSVLAQKSSWTTFLMTMFN